MQLSYSLIIFILLLGCRRESGTPPDSNLDSMRKQCQLNRVIGTPDTSILGTPRESEVSAFHPKDEPYSLVAFQIPLGTELDPNLAAYVQNQTLIVALPSSQLIVKEAPVPEPSNKNLSLTRARSASYPRVQAAKLPNRTDSTSNATPSPKKSSLSPGATFEITWRRDGLMKKVETFPEWSRDKNMKSIRRDVLIGIEQNMKDRNRYLTEHEAYQAVRASLKSSWEKFANASMTQVEFDAQIRSLINKISDTAPNFANAFVLDRVIEREKIINEYHVSLQGKIYSFFSTNWHKILTTTAATLGITSFILHVISVKNANEDAKEEMLPEIPDESLATDNEEEESEEEAEDSSTKQESDNSETEVPIPDEIVNNESILSNIFNTTKLKTFRLFRNLRQNEPIC